MKNFIFIAILLYVGVDSGQIISKMSKKTKSHITSFADLPEDIHFLITENLDINNMFSLAETNKYFSALTAEVFKLKYSETFVEFRYRSYLPEDLYEITGRIYLRFEKTVRKFLKHFGLSITKMKVNFFESEYDEESMQAISRWINLYCSESINTLILYDKSDSFFGQITKPFKALKEIEIFGQYENVKSATLELNEILPVVEHLMLYCVRFSNISQIYRNFPHLNELGVSYYDVYERVYPRKFEENEIEQLLRLNPQIKKLVVHGPSEYTLKVANEALPDLEYLGIEPTWFDLEVSDDAPLITYKNVKILDIDVLHASAPLTHFPRCLAFEKLEEFRASPTSGHDWWIGFIEENAQLKRFKSSSGCVNNDDLMKFAKIKNSNLSEIAIAICKDVEMKNVIEFVQQHQAVKKFRFERSHIPYQSNDETFEMKAQTLCEKFEDEFAIRNEVESIELMRY